jgi:prepilin-type N-terminal cleavage/methylation domain-containing protein
MRRAESQPSRSPAVGRAFTLIELLIVVAIISILASIAVPNFSEAQTRAKVARIQADMRTLLTGLETYAIDHNTYPLRHTQDFVIPELATKAWLMGRITTPISYLTSLPEDIFAKAQRAPNNKIDYWDSRQVRQFLRGRYNLRRWDSVPDYGWLLASVGPDGVIGAPTNAYLDYPYQGGARLTAWYVYDPTNGTISYGNIYRFQGDRDPQPLLEMRP